MIQGGKYKNRNGVIIKVTTKMVKVDIVGLGEKYVKKENVRFIDEFKPPSLDSHGYHLSLEKSGESILADKFKPPSLDSNTTIVSVPKKSKSSNAIILNQ